MESVGGVCNNTVGSYSCSCQNGYDGNGIVEGRFVGNINGTSCKGERALLTLASRFGFGLCGVPVSEVSLLS